MQQDFHKLRNQTILDLTLPGTHESGAYWFSNIISPDAPAFVYRLSREYNISAHTFIRKWAINQHRTIYNQLNDGIRYFDVRIAENEAKELLMSHSLFGVPIKTILDDFKRFLTEQGGEVVVVSFVVRSFVLNQKRAEDLIVDTLGSWLFPRDQGFPTIEEMVRTDKRLMVLFSASHHVPSVLWDTRKHLDDPWANTNDHNTLFSKQLDYTEKRSGDPNRIFNPQWVTTGDEMSIIKSILYQLDLPGQTTAVDGIDRLLFHANARLNEFVVRTQAHRLNVLFVDMYHGTNVVQLSRLMNDGCNDQLSMRGPRGCRSMRSACGEPEIRGACPRTCGLCPKLTGFDGAECTSDSACLSEKCKFGICVKKESHQYGEPCGSNYQCDSGLCNPTTLVCQKRFIGDVCTTTKDCDSGKCEGGKCVGTQVSEWVGNAPLCKGHRDLCNIRNQTSFAISQAISICGDTPSICVIGSKVLCSNSLVGSHQKYVWLAGCHEPNHTCSSVNGDVILKTKCGDSTTICPDTKLRILCGIKTFISKQKTQ